MNTVVNEDPMGPDYWAAFEARDKQVQVDRNRRDDQYGGCDPATWGWRRSTADEVRREREPSDE